MEPPNVTAILVPCTPEVGVIDARTGAKTAGVMVTVAVPTAAGDATLVACTLTEPPAGGTAGAV